MKKQFCLFSFFFLLLVTESWAQKNITTFQLEAPQLQTTKKIWIYLPENYTHTTKKYPVMYLHDAQNLFDAATSYAGEWRIDETLDSLKAEIIVVGIEHGNEKRIDELTPYKNEQYGGGQGNLYLEFMINQLKPYIDSHYRTKTGKYHTAIGGSSLGGLLSYYATLKYPKIFGKAMVFSPAFWINPEVYALTEQTKTIKSKIYFMCGDSESESMVKDMEQMIAALNTTRCSCLHLTKKQIIVNGKHTEKLWANEFAKAYLWLFKI
jgi:predicted alpha/beta superfamily hydrolase